MKQTTKYVMIGALIAVASLTTVGSVIANYDALAGGKYGKNEANSATNSCGNDFLPTNVLCSNIGSQVQGDENAVAITSFQEAASSLMGTIVDGIEDGFYQIKVAIVKPFSHPEPGLDAFLKTHGLIPENGQGGAFGYGLLTTGDSIIVTTTHAGVLDSETQGGDAQNPIWHNHDVQLAEGKTGLCPGKEIDTISFEQPGSVDIQGKAANLFDVPSTFDGTDALTNTPMTWNPGNDVQQAVSFKLDPKFDMSGALQAVCVNDITNADQLIVR
jgi:hypothetical protein